MPAAEPVRLLWAADESWRQRLDRTQMTYPPGPPELEHFQGEVAKLANARHSGDALAMRLAAQDLARSVVSLLRPVNPRPPVPGRVAALRSLLTFDVVPTGYRDDMLACLGLGGGAGDADLYAAARRLAGGVVSLLEANQATFADLLSPQSAATLADGTLRRYVERLGDS